MKSVLITGCSSGFGLRTAVGLAKSGWRVIATMRDLGRRERLDEAARTAGVTLEVLALDVCSTSSVESAVTQTLALTGGTLEALVHNAGIGDGGYFEDMSDETTRRIMETNFFGVLNLTRAVLPIMRTARNGRIVVISSISAFMATPAFSVYGASKWAVEGWAESLSCEVAPFGIQVHLVEPGTYQTDVWQNAQISSPADSPYLPLVTAFEAKIREMNEQHGRDPAEVAQRVVAVLAARRPSFRSPVGPDSWAARGMSHLLPFRARRRLLQRMAGTHRVRT